MCPVSGGIALAIGAGLTTTAGALTATGIAVATIGAAAIGAATAVGIGGVINVATGRGFFEGAGKAALFGGLTAGIGGAFGAAGQAATATGQAATNTLSATTNGISAASKSVVAANSAAQSLQLGSVLTGLAPSTTSFVATTALGGLASALTPEPYALALPQASQQDFSTPAIRTTGSGGSKAAVSLAEAVTRSKQRKLSQADVSSLSVDTSSFASGGLQFA